MAVYLTEGFDMYNGTGTNTGLSSKWNLGSGVSLQAGRFGTSQSMQVTTFDFSNATYARKTLNTAIGGSLTVACAFQQVGWGSNGAIGSIIALMYQGATQCGWRVDNLTGAVQAWRYTSNNNGTLLGTSSNNVITVGNWHYVEMEVVLSTTVGRITIKVDGVTQVNVTGANTQNAGSALCDMLHTGYTTNLIGQNFMGTYRLDDLYILDTATSLGERRIETLRPASDSSIAFSRNGGSTNFGRVNENTVDGDTSFVSSSTVNARDLYGLTPLSSTPTTIDAVTVVSFAEKTDATTRAIYNSVQSNGTDSDGSSIFLSASYNRYDRIIALDPNTGLAWTASGVNNLLIGPKVAV